MRGEGQEVGGNSGGREGTRTLDFLRAREALSQLSYSPTVAVFYCVAP